MTAERPPIRPRRTDGRTRVWGVAASLSFHVLALLALAGSASGEFVSAAAGGSDFVAVEVVLVGPLRRPRSEPETVADPGALKPLFAKYRVDMDDPPVTISPDQPDGRLAAMARRYAAPETRPRTAQSYAEPQPLEAAQAPPPSSQRSELLARADQAGLRDGVAASASGSTGVLWGRIEPCWRKIGLREARAVTLEVSLDAGGKLASPPRILRRADTYLNEDQLRAEAAAIAALQACLPRNDVRLGGRTHRLEFAARGG